MTTLPLLPSVGAASDRSGVEEALGEATGEPALVAAGAGVDGSEVVDPAVEDASL